MDTKKKELLGNFYREGELLTTGVLETFDHDLGTASAGKVVPHGFYDVKRNVGHITLGVRHDTSQFACDSFFQWWRRHGERAYPAATSILLLCDGGEIDALRECLCFMPPSVPDSARFENVQLRPRRGHNRTYVKST